MMKIFKKIILEMVLLVTVCSATLAQGTLPKIDGFFNISWGTKWKGMKSVNQITKRGYDWCNHSNFRGPFAGDAQADISLYFTSDNKFNCGKAHCFWSAANLENRYVQILNELEKKYGPPQDDWNAKDYDYQSHGKHWLGTSKGDTVHITCTLTVDQDNQPKCVFLQYWNESLYDRQPTDL